MDTFLDLCELLDLPRNATVSFSGSDPILPTRFKLAETAAGVLGAIGVAAGEIWKLRGGDDQVVSVDVNHVAAALNSFRYHRIVDRMDPAERFSAAAQTGTTAIYATKDGRFFHTHGSFDAPGMCAELGVVDPTPEKMAAAVGQWNGLELEQHLEMLGRCGAMVRSADEWAQHPHGQALAEVPVLEVLRVGDSDPEPFEPAERPLSGLRVLDLTRVLAGPTCARTLAEHGADVLKIGAAHLPTIEAFDLDTCLGKRWANLNLKEDDARATLNKLAAEADVFSEGFRPGVMSRFGFSPEALHELRPGIIAVSINCYGHTGPFAHRPGWEQLGQSVSGMAYEEGSNGADIPRLVPAAACDYTTGYLAALGVLAALLRRAQAGGSYHVRVSLARTGMWYMQQPRVAPSTSLPEEIPTREEMSQFTGESTTYAGVLKHLTPVVQMSNTPTRWACGSPEPGSATAAWL